MKYLYEKDNIVYAKCTNCDRVLKFKKYEIGEVSTGVECFCGFVSDSIDGLPSAVLSKPQTTQANPAPVVKQTQKPVAIQQKPVRISNLPMCPTCGSGNVEKISFASKAIGGAMWGLFSSNIRNTFRCNNCGYKW